MRFVHHGYSLVILAMFLTPTHAALVINVGNHVAPVGSTVTIDIDVTGGDLVSGLNFYIQVGDGGATNSGVDTVPAIVGVDIVGAGTLFFDNNSGQTNTISDPLLWAATTTTLGPPTRPDPISAVGTIAHVTINMSGTTVGTSYDLKLRGVADKVFAPLGVATDFAGVAASITNGTITATVPEPNATWLMALAGVVAGIGAACRKQA